PTLRFGARHAGRRWARRGVRVYPASPSRGAADSGSRARRPWRRREATDGDPPGRGPRARSLRQVWNAAVDHGAATLVPRRPAGAPRDRQRPAWLAPAARGVGDRDVARRTLLSPRRVARPMG